MLSGKLNNFRYITKTHKYLKPIYCVPSYNEQNIKYLKPTYCVPSYNEKDIKYLNNIFYNCPDLSGNELKTLVNKHRLQFNLTDDNDVELLIYNNDWYIDERTWAGMADILNTWRIGDQIREKIKNYDLTIDNPTIIIRLIIADEDLIG